MNKIRSLKLSSLVLISFLFTGCENKMEKIELNDPHDKDEYVFTLLDDDSLLNEMIIKSKEETHKESRVIMILKKKNDAVITLEENKPYQKPAITDFQAEPVAQ